MMLSALGGSVVAVVAASALHLPGTPQGWPSLCPSASPSSSSQQASCSWRTWRRTSPTASPFRRASATASATSTLAPEAYGARGDGITDDTRALQATLDAAPAGSTVWLKGTYRHTDVLRLRSDRVVLDGGGSLVASNEQRSAVWLDADGLTVRNLTFRMAGTGPRYTAYEQMKIRCSHRSGLILTNIKVQGSAAAGVFLEGVSNFRASQVSIQDTRADGFHMTGGSTGGQLDHIAVTRSGDDGVAVVSYSNDRRVASDITVTSSSVSDQRWGRGFSVVGGERVTLRDIAVTRSAGAGLYVASEGKPFYTRGTAHVVADRVQISQANVNHEVSQGAVLVYSAGAGHQVHDVTISNLHVRDTDPQSGRVAGIIGPSDQVWDVQVDGRDLNPGRGMTGLSRVL